MALETTKTTYLNGSSKDGNRVLANFSSSLSEDGTMTINETISESTNLDTVEADFNEFRELAKNELKKLNAQDAETDVSSDKTVDKEVANTTPDNEAVKDDKLADTSIKADDKPETGAPDESKVLDVKDSEVKQPTSSEETKQPISGEETKQPVVSEEIKQPTSNEEPKQPVPSEGIKQPASSEEVKDSEPVGTSIKTDDKPETGTPKEVKASDVKDGENADESN